MHSGNKAVVAAFCLWFYFALAVGCSAIGKRSVKRDDSADFSSGASRVQGSAAPMNSPIPSPAGHHHADESRDLLHVSKKYDLGTADGLFANYLYLLPVNLDVLGRPEPKGAVSSSPYQWNSWPLRMVLGPLRRYREKNNILWGLMTELEDPLAPACKNFRRDSFLAMGVCSPVSLFSMKSFEKRLKLGETDAGNDTALRVTENDIGERRSLFWWERLSASEPDPMRKPLFTLNYAKGSGLEVNLENHGQLVGVTNGVTVAGYRSRSQLRNVLQAEQGLNCDRDTIVAQCNLAEIRNVQLEGSDSDASFHVVVRGNPQASVVAIQGKIALVRDGKRIYAAQESGGTMPSRTLSHTSAVFNHALVADATEISFRYFQAGGVRQLRARFLGGSEDGMPDEARLVRRQMEKGICESGIGLQQGFAECSESLLSAPFWLQESYFRIPGSHDELKELTPAAAPVEMRSVGQLRPESAGRWFFESNSGVQSKSASGGFLDVPRRQAPLLVRSAADVTEALMRLENFAKIKARFKVKMSAEKNSWFGLHFSKKSLDAKHWQQGAGALLRFYADGQYVLDSQGPGGYWDRPRLAEGHSERVSTEMTVELQLDGLRNTLVLKVGEAQLLEISHELFGVGAFSFETYDGAAEISDLVFETELSGSNN